MYQAFVLDLIVACIHLCLALNGAGTVYPVSVVAIDKSIDGSIDKSNERVV